MSFATDKPVCKQTGTGVCATCGDTVLWNLEIDTPEGRPFFHPLRLPSGMILTDSRPQDHVWHLGYWFSWKFINGVNYWEPTDIEGKGCEPEGRTAVVRKSVQTNGAHCEVELDLEYGPRSTSVPVMREHRVITVETDCADCTIRSRHDFTALSDVVLDRTPPYGSTESGQWAGGYAGMTLRLSPEAAKALSVKGKTIGNSPAECTGREMEGIEFYNDNSGDIVTFSQHGAPLSGRFYMWPSKLMINPSPVYESPLLLKNGENLYLEYKLTICKQF